MVMNDRRLSQKLMSFALRYLSRLPNGVKKLAIIIFLKSAFSHLFLFSILRTVFKNTLTSSLYSMVYSELSLVKR